MKTNLIVLDTETGGFSDKENPITEVCLYIVNPATFKIVDKYQTYVRPYKNLKITKSAIEATQVSMVDIENGVELKTMVNMLMVYFKKARNGSTRDYPQLVGHNASFDIGFLKVAFDFCGKDLFSYIDSVPICTYRMIKLHDASVKNEKLETASASLTSSCERFGIKLKSAHGAEADVIATTALLKALTSKLRNSGDTKAIKEEKIVEEKSRKFFQF